MTADQGNRVAESGLPAPASGGAAIAASRRGCGVLRRLRCAGRRRPHSEIAIAAVLFAAVLLTTVAGPPQGRAPLDATTILAAVACGALIVRRRWPFSALAVASLAAEAYLAPLDGHAGVLLLAAPLIALYTVAEAGARRRLLLAGGLAVLVLGGGHMLFKPASWIGAENIALAALGGLAVAAGEASRNRRAYLAEVEHRMRRAEEDRKREARRQVTDERLRIARDLHDVVGHQLALINIQAGVAAHILDAQPDQVRQSLVHIRHASRTALEELRETIGLLREFDEPDAPTGPTAGLDSLIHLLASFRDAGLRIEHKVEGTPRPLPPATDLTAYRVIQESLTNVRKHAGAVTARLSLVYRPTALRVVVDNDADTAPARPTEPIRPAAAPPDGSGHGIVGMRERVAALGGDLRAGPHAGGFQVRATLPLPAPPPPSGARPDPEDAP